MNLTELTPKPPDYRVDWPSIEAGFRWVQPMKDCPQDPHWHAEGDVWTHTKMVVEALTALPRWRALCDDERRILFLGALLHDIAKPECTRTESDGRITSRGHAGRGAIGARVMLWRQGVSFAEREAIATLVELHMEPVFFVERKDGDRHVIGLSHASRCDHLELIAEADVRGRTCSDEAEKLDDITMFAEHCRELGCHERPYPFESDHARFIYFHHRRRSRHAPAYDDTRGCVTVMSGLPAAGKDRWIADHGGDEPVVSLDELRRELGVDPGGDQGAVIQRARELAREHLRAGEPFIWNATNVSRKLRRHIISLAADYKARIRLAYVEASAAVLEADNRRREQSVPQKVMDKLLKAWTVPRATEAHELLVSLR